MIDNTELGFKICVQHGERYKDHVCNNDCTACGHPFDEHNNGEMECTHTDAGPSDETYMCECEVFKQL